MGFLVLLKISLELIPKSSLHLEAHTIMCCLMAAYVLKNVSLSNSTVWTGVYLHKLRWYDVSGQYACHTCGPSRTKYHYVAHNCLRQFFEGYPKPGRSPPLVKGKFQNIHNIFYFMYNNNLLSALPRPSE